jgi:two-component system, NtrC family, sensor kinase
MVLPALLIGAEAIRSNALEQRALQTLGDRLGRNRTYAELETAMFDQSEVIWRYLSGLDPGARKEFTLVGQVVDYRFEQWKSELAPEDAPLAEAIQTIQAQFVAVGDSVFRLVDQGQRARAYQIARDELKLNLQPALTSLNRQIYRRTRETSVQGAFARVEEIVHSEQRLLVGVFLASLAVGIAAAWFMARSLARPIEELRQAMAVVGGGNLDHPIETRSRDEIGELATAFAGMTAQLRESRDRLVQSEKLASIGEMAAAVAHGLRNPLASLRASAQLVLRHPNSPAAGEQLHAIIEEVDRLDRRITHLLTFSRPAPFHPIPERVSALVQGVLPAFAERIRSQAVTLNVDVPESLPDVRVDPMKLEQALLELMANALDAMPSGGTLSIGATTSTDAQGVAGVTVTVRDTGGGISPEALASVGQPFFTTRAEGTGLGLATARRFVEQHGGTLDLESTRGTGTAIHVWLPVSLSA